jgi:hypothetical protein
MAAGHGDQAQQRCEPLLVLRGEGQPAGEGYLAGERYLKSVFAAYAAIRNT